MRTLNLTYYQRNRDLILNKAKDYCKNNKEGLKEQARDKYKSLSEEEKNKKREYGKNSYHNMSEEKKQRLKEYQKEFQKKFITRQKEDILKKKLLSIIQKEAIKEKSRAL